jgi:serine/threonine protein kinase
MEVTSCPDPMVWQQYILGLVEEAEQQVLEAHLATCPACLERLGRVPGEDTLVADLRSGLTVADDPRDAAVEQVIRSAAGLAAGETEAPAGGQPQRTTVVLDFLAPPQTVEEIGRLAGFRVLRLLGRGGMGMVFLAEDTALRRRVALKVLSPDFARRPDAAERFLREARAAAALHHDHVITIYQVGEADSPAGRVPFLAMELLEGASLEATLAEGPVALAEAVRIGREIAEGLAAAHESGLIHRDVKPDNIWLETPRGRVKLLDFGLARAVQLESRLTEHGAVVGTPSYMAPEQAAGQPVDARADLFSLGCVLYRLCTGRLPFAGSDVMAVLSALATQEPVPVCEANPAVPAALADLIHRLLAKAPAGRPASARQVVALLDGIAPQLAATISLPASRPRPSRSWRRNWFLAALAVLAALIVLSVVVLRPPGAPAEFVIDTDDRDLMFRADDKGGVVLEDRKTDRRYQMKVGRHDPATGEYEIDVSEPVAGLHFSTRTLTIKRGERVALKASIRPLALPAGITGIDPDWLQKVARLPANDQVAAVTARLKELNPGFEGPVTPTIEEGVVVGLFVPTPKITNVAPVRALPGLRELKCYAPSGPLGQLSDLTPLAGLPLKVLWVRGNDKLSNLKPLEGMPLVELNCQGTIVADLTPLHKCPLESLHIAGTRVRSLDALKGLPLKKLYCHDSVISDLSPLAGMRLEVLICLYTQVHDLSPLRKMPLTSLCVASCRQITDLSPLQGMPLDDLDVRAVGTTDLTPLNGAPLRHLQADEAAILAHRQMIKALPKLGRINDQPALKFWAALDAKKANGDR